MPSAMLTAVSYSMIMPSTRSVLGDSGGHPASWGDVPGRNLISKPSSIIASPSPVSRRLPHRNTHRPAGLALVCCVHYGTAHHGRVDGADATPPERRDLHKEVFPWAPREPGEWPLWWERPRWSLPAGDRKSVV